MYSKLIKQLRASCESCKLWDGYKCCLKGECSAQKSLQAADAIEELQTVVDGLTKQTIMVFEKTEGRTVIKLEPKWIPVTERLPENDVPVLLSCKCGAGAYICDGFHTEKYSTPIPFYADIDADYNEEADEYYFPEGWWEIIKNWDDYSCVAIEDTITHWMPLPQPPKDGET